MDSNVFAEETPVPRMSLEERVMAFTEENTVFTFHDLKLTFPTEADKNIYRAINRLESDGRIKFLYYQNKRKHYTSSGVSKLPNLKGATGNTMSLRVLFDNLEQVYDTGHYESAQELDTLPINYCRLFWVAQIDDPAEKKRAFLELHRELMTQRQTLSMILANLDQVIKHPTMSGDMDYFTKIFGGEEAPSGEAIAKFKAWYRKFLEAQNNV